MQNHISMHQHTTQGHRSEYVTIHTFISTKGSCSGAALKIRSAFCNNHQMEQQPTLSQREAGSRYYRIRYSTDPEFRKRERERAAAYIDRRREHYKRLWRARYVARKAAAAAAAAAPGMPQLTPSSAAQHMT